MSADRLVLFRPVGPVELALIEASDRRSFPPRLPERPFFHPVLNLEYAVRIASTWNVDASGAGFVTRVEIDAAFASRYPVRTVGAAGVHREIWVPAEELAALNAHIIGRIEVVDSFRRDPEP